MLGKAKFCNKSWFILVVNFNYIREGFLFVLVLGMPKQTLTCHEPLYWNPWHIMKDLFLLLYTRSENQKSLAVFSDLFNLFFNHYRNLWHINFFNLGWLNSLPNFFWLRIFLPLLVSKIFCTYGTRNHVLHTVWRNCKNTRLFWEAKVQMLLITENKLGIIIFSKWNQQKLKSYIILQKIPCRWWTHIEGLSQG